MLLALVIISVSGCVILNKTGWDWEKYEKYSEFYDKINSSISRDYMDNSRTIEEIDTLMVDMAGDTEFDKTWKLAFLSLKQGMEAEREAYEFQLDQVEREQENYRESRQYDYDRPLPNPSRIARERFYRYPSSIVKKHYNQFYEYRQKIEEMKPSR